MKNSSPFTTKCEQMTLSEPITRQVVLMNPSMVRVREEGICAA